LADAPQFFGYIALCVTASRDGEGIAAEWKLETRDLARASSIEKMTDGEIFWMLARKREDAGEGDRTAEKVRWTS